MRKKTSMLVFLLILLSVLCATDVTDAQRDCGECYRMDAGAITGIIVGDIVITVLIALTVFYFANRMNKKARLKGDMKMSEKSSMKMQEKCKVESLETESPYQELHGQKAEIYSDLRHQYK
ncbi:TYRO protein tyrosine kinase-binding protein-like isoform X2 [Protopterus annectens]|uniref:TYRO protein tyrosine kinase-binding protein-like isoform X2 n=1 Tax=Protopterus annectens TaxID=7888 RepID=UPI001CFB5556|nr:TYRO protein tyrosine kinase-binding protein-like isoform X2 [Protopterus annectens]